MELLSILLSDGEMKVQQKAFEKCANLKEVSIPSSISLIENFAFKDCSQLKKISIASSVGSIGCGGHLKNIYQNDSKHME